MHDLPTIHVDFIKLLAATPRGPDGALDALLTFMIAPYSDVTTQREGSVFYVANHPDAPFEVDTVHHNIREILEDAHDVAEVLYMIGALFRRVFSANNITAYKARWVKDEQGQVGFYQEEYCRAFVLAFYRVEVAS